MSIKWKVQEFLSGTGKKTIPGSKIDYRNAPLEIKETLRYLLEGIGITAMFSYFFYRSLWAMAVLSPLIIFYCRYRRKQNSKKRREILEQQFKETLISAETNLQAGYSMENAFLESYSDLIRLYGKNCDMAKELLQIKRELTNGKSLETLLWDLGRRCPGNEIEEFAEIYAIASRTGNRWSDTISKMTAFISQKLEIKQEIEIIIHGRKTESRIMCLIPFFILMYMDITSPGYFDVLYGNPAGILIMSCCLAAYVAACLIMEKITAAIH